MRLPAPLRSFTSPAGTSTTTRRIEPSAAAELNACVTQSSARAPPATSSAAAAMRVVRIETSEWSAVVSTAGPAASRRREIERWSGGKVIAWVPAGRRRASRRDDGVPKNSEGAVAGPLEYDSPKSMMVVISYWTTSSRRPSLKPYRPSWLPFNSPPFMPYGTSRSRLLGKTCRIAPAILIRELGESGTDDLQHPPKF